MWWACSFLFFFFPYIIIVTAFKWCVAYATAFYGPFISLVIFSRNSICRYNARITRHCAARDACVPPSRRSSRLKTATIKQTTTTTTTTTVTTHSCHPSPFPLVSSHPSSSASGPVRPTHVRHARPYFCSVCYFPDKPRKRSVQRVSGEGRVTGPVDRRSFIGSNRPTAVSRLRLAESDSLIFFIFDTKLDT